jgi:hypothetical protein
MTVNPTPVTVTRTVDSRVVPPSPATTLLEGHRPSCKAVTTGAAGTDNILSRPLGYRVKALTVIAPGSLYNSGANSDSVYLDLEEINLQAGVTPGAIAGPHEIPPGTALTIEEIDPGWIHFGSPTANQRLMVSYGGPTQAKVSAN